MKIVETAEMDRGLAYAEACFETFRVIDGEVFAWSQHIRRLRAGLCEFNIALDDDDIESLYHAVINTAQQMGGDMLVRLTVSGGEVRWGLCSKSDAATAHLQIMPTAEPEPARLALCNWPFPLKPKPAKFTADYAETLRALCGKPNADVLFAQDEKLIAAATANLLLYRHGVWWTPEGDGVLPGVVRAALIDAGIVKVAKLPVAWLAEAEAIALCNSGIFIRPVAEITAYGSYDIDHPALLRLWTPLRASAGVPGELS